MIKRLSQYTLLSLFALSAMLASPQVAHAGVCVYGQTETCFTGTNQGQCLTRCNQVHGCSGVRFVAQYDTCEQFKSGADEREKSEKIKKELLDITPENEEPVDLSPEEIQKIKDDLGIKDKKDKKSTGSFSIPSAQPLNPFGGAKIPDILGRLLKIATGIIGSITLVVIIYGGVVFMAQGANADKRRKSLEILVWAGLGVCAIFASYALITFIVRAFGI